jgi:hypothetical protein
MRRGRFLLLALLLALGVRAVLLPAFSPAFDADIEEYVTKARILADEGHPRSQEVREDGTRFYRTLGYPLALAGWYKATCWRSVLSARVFNLLLALVTVWLLVVAGEAFGLAVAGRFAALGLAVHLPHAMFSVIPYGETWAALLIVAFAVLLEILRRRLSRPGPVWAPAAAIGLVAGLLFISRTEYLWLPFLALAVLALPRLRRPRAILVAAGVALAAAAVPVAVNHTMRRGYPGILRTSVQGGLILYFGNNPIEVSGHGNGTPEVRARLRELSSEAPLRKAAIREALRWMKENPLAVLGNVPKKLHYLWLAKPEGFGWRTRVGEPNGLDPLLARLLGSAGWVQWLLVLLAGVAGLWRHRERFGFWLAVLAIHTFFFSILAPVPRFHCPLEPILMLGAAAWLVAPRPGREGN